MLGLLFVLFLTGITLSVVLWVGTLFLQGYLYTEANPNTYWQAPAAGAALTLFLLFWCVLDINATHDQGPGFEPYDTLFQFSAVQDLDTRPASKIWVIRPAVKDPIPYKLQRIVKGAGGGKDYEYVDPVNQRLGSLAGVEAILLEDSTGKLGEKGEKVRFNLNKEGDIGSSRFVGPEGWEMGENNLGQPSKFRLGRFLGNLFLNFTHLALWFVVLWLLLHFQWAHALGFAIVLWLVFTLTLLPSLLSRCGEIARPQPTSPASGAALSRTFSYYSRCA